MRANEGKDVFVLVDTRTTDLLALARNILSFCAREVWFDTDLPLKITPQ